jgi:hypothetical protein
MSAQLHVLEALLQVSFELEAWRAPEMSLEALGKRTPLSPAENLTGSYSKQLYRLSCLDFLYR